MREISITYRLGDKEEKRLIEITEKYKAQGINMAVDEMFEFIMITGSLCDIKSRFQLHEQLLALMVQKKTNEEVLKNVNVRKTAEERN